MDEVKLYLSSLESERFTPVRECRFVRPIVIGERKPAVVVDLSSGVPGDDFGLADDIATFVLTTRFEGVDIGAIEEFPCFVFIALPRLPLSLNVESVSADDLQIVAWGELYRTSKDAKGHRFG